MSTIISDKNQRESQIPKRPEAYTTYLYWGFAVIFVILLVVGFTRF